LRFDLHQLREHHGSVYSMDASAAAIETKARDFTVLFS
jgi:hypothetical protein